jgi:hypothetical protein
VAVVVVVVVGEEQQSGSKGGIGNSSSSSSSKSSDLDSYAMETYASQLVRRKDKTNNNPFCSVYSKN